MGRRIGGSVRVETPAAEGKELECEHSASDPQISDATLVAGVLAGDRDAFEILVRRHQPFLFRRARWMGLDADTAADVVQETFIKAYQSLARCREPGRFGFWTGQMLRNRCLDLLKSAARRCEPLPPVLIANGSNPEDEAQRSGLRDQLNVALEMLPEEQREAFLMKHGEGLSYDEMAEVVGSSVSAMKMRVHRATEALREQLHFLRPVGSE
jgi:RNA polymerase sigma-70 factor (ECF subfamily)